MSITLQKTEFGLISFSNAHLVVFKCSVLLPEVFRSLENFPINMQHFPNFTVNDVCRTRKLVVWNRYRMVYILDWIDCEIFKIRTCLASACLKRLPNEYYTHRHTHTRGHARTHKHEVGEEKQNNEYIINLNLVTMCRQT